MSLKKEQKEKSMVLALLLFIGAAGLLVLYLGSEDGKKSLGNRPAAIAKSKDYENSVNRHLMLTNERMALEKQRMALENARLMNEPINAIKPQRAYSNDNTLDLSADRRAEEIANELGRGHRRAEIRSPHDIVQQEIYNEQLAQEESQAYREEYARQFVENARRGGYKVKLSEDLSRVISVTPIRNPTTEMELFSGGSTQGSQ